MEKAKMTAQNARLIALYADNYIKANFDSRKLSAKHVQVIELIAPRNPEPLPQKKIEEYLDVSHPTLVNILSEMERNGLVVCRYDNGDKRCKNVYLTETALEFYNARCDTQHKFAQICDEAISDKEKEQLFVIVGKITDYLKTNKSL